MSGKKALNSHHPRVQSSKNWISDIASIQTGNMLNLHPAGKVSSFNQFFRDLSNNTLDIYNLDTGDTHCEYPHNIKQSILNEAYQSVMQKGLPTNSCPDFLGINKDTQKVDIYELKNRRICNSNGSEENIPPISLSIEQFLKYEIDLAGRWDSDFTIVGCLYTIGKDIKKIKEPRTIAKNMNPKHIVLIPAGYIIEHSTNFKNSLSRLGITINDVKDKNPDILSKVKKELKKTEYKAAYFTLGSKEISDIIHNNTDDTVHKRELTTKKEIIRWQDNENKTRWMNLDPKKISVYCVENGTKLDTFFNRITENMRLIEENGSIHTGIDDLLKQFPKDINTAQSTKLSQFC